MVEVKDNQSMGLGLRVYEVGIKEIGGDVQLKELRVWIGGIKIEVGKVVEPWLLITEMWLTGDHYVIL